MTAVPRDHTCMGFPPLPVRRHECKVCGATWRLSSRTIGGVIYPQWLRVSGPGEVRKSA